MKHYIKQNDLVVQNITKYNVLQSACRKLSAGIPAESIFRGSKQHLPRTTPLILSWKASVTITFFLLLLQFPALILNSLSDWEEEILLTLHCDDRRDIALINSNGNDFRIISPTLADAWNASWLPDGNRIVFMSNQSGESRIYLMDVDSSTISDINYQPGEADMRPVVSPDGQQIAFMSRRNEFTDWDDIYIMNIDGSNLRLLTDNSEYNDNPSWSPNGTKLAFDSVHNNIEGVYIWDIGNKVIALLTEPNWGARDAS